MAGWIGVNDVTDTHFFIVLMPKIDPDSEGYYEFDKKPKWWTKSLDEWVQFISSFIFVNTNLVGLENIKQYLYQYDEED